VPNVCLFVTIVLKKSVWFILVARYEFQMFIVILFLMYFN